MTQRACYTTTVDKPQLALPYNVSAVPADYDSLFTAHRIQQEPAISSCAGTVAKLATICCVKCGHHQSEITKFSCCVASYWGGKSCPFLHNKSGLMDAENLNCTTAADSDTSHTTAQRSLYFLTTQSQHSSLPRRTARESHPSFTRDNPTSPGPRSIPTATSPRPRHSRPRSPSQLLTLSLRALCVSR